ncbi:hypothetical protein TNCV_3562301 [Trichonephila clavipes]|nr:hypothetical protein TNCV_3562301 [Trichonephila clavipes]
MNGQKIAQDYKDKSNMPNCIGCADGKTLSHTAPTQCWISFIIIKISIQLCCFADADAYACFNYDRSGCLWEGITTVPYSHQSEMGKAYNAKQLNIPQRGFSLPGSAHRTEMYIVGDEAFPGKRI